MKNALIGLLALTTLTVWASIESQDVCKLNEDIDILYITDDPGHIMYVPKEQRIIPKFLAQGGNINGFCNDRTPLMALAETEVWSLPERLQELLAAGARLDLKNTQGQSVLNFAFHNRHDKLFYSLIEAGAKVSGESIDGTTLIKALFQKGLQEQNDRRHLWRAFFALASGYNPKGRKFSWEFQKSDLQDIKASIQTLNDPDALAIAVTAAQRVNSAPSVKYKVIPAVLGLGIDVLGKDVFGSTALHGTTDGKLLEQLLKTRLVKAINEQNINGDTALIGITKYAYLSRNANERLEAIKVLLKYKANKYLKDRFGKTALEYEIGLEDKDPRIIKLLQ